MKIDLKRLRSDVQQLKSRRAGSPLGRTKTGATQVIRAHFDELESMHRGGASWNEIAAGLAAQGVTQGQGQPLTGRRLTALMHNIRARAEKLKSRAVSLDADKFGLGPSKGQPRTSVRTVSLSPDMNRGGSQPKSEHPVSEDKIRRAELSKHAHLLRKR